MRTKIFLFTTIILISLINVNAQTVTDTVSLVPSSVQEGKFTSKTNVVTYDFSNYAIGKIFPTADSSSVISRTYHSFSLLQIPTNATITSVKVNYTTDFGSYTFKITKVTNITPYHQTNWETIGNGSTMDQGITYGSSSLFSANIKTQIQNLLSTGSIILGTLSENETANDSYSSVMFLSLEVIYTRPVTLLNFYAQNDLDGAGGGNIGVGINTAATSHSSPYAFTAYEEQQINLQAYDNQYVNESMWVFNDTEAPLNKSDWKKNVGGDVTFLSSNSSASITADTLISNATFIAYLKKYVQPTFQNNFINVGNGGVIKINNVQYNSPAAQDSVIEGNAINATAISQSFNNITYYFSNWSTGSTNATETFYPTSNSTITANFVGIAAQSVGLNFEASDPNLPITLNWTEYPNDSVTQYKIWRRVRYQQEPTGNPVLLATVSRGTTTYIDYDFYGTNLGFTDWMLWYDVRSYYSTEGTYPDPNWAQVFSGGLIPKVLGEMTVKVNKIENYPNPFNPSTIIRYQIVKAGHVTLKVYDTLGREVANLVDKQQPSGKYSVNFNASSLSSGVYLYRITANGFTAVKKMILLR